MIEELGMDESKVLRSVKGHWFKVISLCSRRPLAPMLKNNFWQIDGPANKSAAVNYDKKFYSIGPCRRRRA